MTLRVPRDECEARIDLAADHLAYLVISYGLLLAVAFRSFLHGDAASDLLGLLVLSGIVGVAYRLRRGAVTGRWTLMLMATVGIAIVVSIMIAVAGR